MGLMCYAGSGTGPASPSRPLRRILRRMQPDLSPEDCAAIAALLRDTIAADRFPMSPRIKRMRAILNKLDPPAPKPAPFPPLKPPGQPSMLMAKKQAWRR